MKTFSLDKLSISGCLFLILLPQLLCAQSEVTTAQTPVHLQLEKKYFMAGDTAGYVLQTAEDHNAWYLIDLYENADSSQAAAIQGELMYGKSTGRLPLPDHLNEGVYWLRTQVDGIPESSFMPVYVFSKPKEIEPEAQPAFQLQLEADHGRLFAGTTNQLSYELWPRPLLPDGRLIVRNGQGDILADTLLEQSGKGIVEVSPEPGDKLQAEVWLNEERTISSSLPEVIPVSFEWQLTDGALALWLNKYDSIRGLSVSIRGPEGFELEEAIDGVDSLSLGYTSWPSGEYTLMLLRGPEPLLQESFRLRTKEPALHLQQHEIPVSKQVLMHARVNGVDNIQGSRSQLRVYSAAQQIQILSLQENRGRAGQPGDMPVHASGLNPERLEGIVKDSAGNPVAKAVVTLSGKGLDRMFYAISDEAGSFAFDNLPLTGEDRYLAAFDQENRSLLYADAALPTKPASFPAYELDPDKVLRAKSYAQKHFLLGLLQNEGVQNEAAQKEEQQAGSKALELKVPQDWIETFNAGDYIEFPSLTEFTQEVIPGLRVRYRDGKSYMQVLNIVNSRNKIYYKGEPLYLLNGYPVSSADSLLSVDMALIDKVQLVRNNASFDYGRLAQYGIVAIYTLEDKVQAHLPEEGSWLPVIGLNQGGTDFSASQQQANAGLPDFREVITWTGVDKVQPDGSFSFVLNSSDEAGEFIVEITIYHEDGRLTTLTHPVKVAGPSVP